jgi:hypothetical protein
MHSLDYPHCTVKPLIKRSKPLRYTSRRRQKLLPVSLRSVSVTRLSLLVYAQDVTPGGCWMRLVIRSSSQRELIPGLIYLITSTGVIIEGCHVIGLEKICVWSTNLLNCALSKCSLMCSQNLATDPSPEPAESIPVFIFQDSCFVMCHAMLSRSVSRARTLQVGTSRFYVK